MADFTKTITNGLRVFGAEFSTKWGQSVGTPYTMVWGTTNWGEGSYTLVINVQKLIENSVAPTFDYARSESTKLINNTMSVDADMGTETLSQGDWNYVFPSDITDIEDRSRATWTEGSGSTTSYTTATAGSTTWT